MKIIGPIEHKGAELWRIVDQGKVKTIKTSPSSLAAINEAMHIYRHALKRLANASD